MVLSKSFGTRCRNTLTLLCAGGVLGACAGDDGSVIISGDVAGLDSIALRGDSLLAASVRAPSEIDSLRAVAEGRLPGIMPIAQSESLVGSLGGTLTAPSASPATGGAALTQRAQARGDSMARAAAQRFATGATAGSRSRADSVRGVVRLQGAAPITQPVLQVAGISAPVMLSGLATSGMQRLEGAEVVVRGVRVSPRDIVVADYFVRNMRGIPAYDGMLHGSDEGYSLVLSDGSGRKRISSPPPGLRELAGTRVWLAIPDGSSTPQSYGFISRR